MKNQKFVSLGIFLVLCLAIVPLLSATTTINVPVTNGNYSTTLNLNVTTDLADTLNVTCYYNASGGTATTLLTAIANTSVSQTAFTKAVTISSLTDSATYNISCIATDGASPETDSNTGITFDSTDPVVSLFVDLGGDNQAYGSLIEYSCTTTDAIDSSPTETFVVAHPTGDSPSSTSLTLQSTKLQFLDTDFAGDFVFTCTSEDYTGNSASSSSTVKVGDAGRPISVSNNSGSDSIDSKWIWMGLGVVAIIYFVTRKK
jgi:hypothetical protein